jgi:recombinational DNA repair ATPase RecF
MNRALYQTLDRRTFMDRLVIQVYPSHFHSLNFSFMAQI